MAARVQKPAPDFAGTAVINNDFKDIKLADFKGKYLVGSHDIPHSTIKDLILS